VIDDLKPYSKMKDSNVPWLGEVPEHWDVKRGKEIFRCIDVRSSTGTEELLTVSSGRGVVPRSLATVTMFKAESYVGYKLCWPDDLVINSLWAWGRGLGVSRHYGIVSSAYGVYRLRPQYVDYARYIHELVRSAPFNWELQVRSKGIWISRLQLTDEAFLGAPFPIPPTDEQSAIVRFLDHADRRIRRYIRAKQKLIKLLEEQKQAIIHRAVTRGLDPSVRLKPSGVDSLGDVPEHWDVQRLKALVTEAVAGPYGSSLTKAMYTSDGYRVYGQQQVIPDDFATGDYFISPAKFEQMKQYRVLPGDILVSVMGTVGRVAVVPDNVEPGIINPRLVRYRPDFSRVRPRYLQLTMQSPPSRAQIVEASKGTTMEGLNMQVLGQLRINLPPLTEQDAILGAISHKASALQRASNDAGREITLLREYRTRLIADVVTGKLDVREAAARLPDEAAECEALDEIGDLDLPEDAMAEDLDAAVEESGE